MWTFLVLLLFAFAPAGHAQKNHEVCQNCHEDKLNDYKTHKHFAGGLSCDACHGESEQHASSNAAVAPDRVSRGHEIPELCGSCHGDAQQQYAASKHAALVLAKAGKSAPQCATCHGHHRPRTAAHTLAQCQKCHAKLSEAHPKMEADTLCWTCHSPHTLKTAAK
jgi:hypothetical protein